MKVTERSLTSKIVSFIFPASLLMNTARIQKSAEFLSDIMKQKHGPNEEKSREQRQPPFSHSQIFHAFRKDNSDGRTLGRQTEAQERDAGFMQDRMGKHEHRPVINCGTRFGAIWENAM